MLMKQEAWVIKFLKHRNLLGLDIGSHTVKAVQFVKKGEQLRLVSLAHMEIPPEIQEEADPALHNDMLANAIKQMLKENKINAKEAVTSIAGDNVIVRYVKLPKMSEEELKNVISYEGEQYIPLAINQVVMDHTILGELEEEGSTKMEVLLVAAKEEIVDEHIRLLQLAGLNPALIDVDSFALQNAYELNYGVIDETIGLIHIGAKLTTINILENGVTHLTRDVAVAGNNFTREIQREFDVTFHQAEELKCQEGEVPIETEDILQMEMPKKQNNAKRIGDAIAPVLNKLIAEIQRSFDYYTTSIRKRPVSRIILSGGTSRLKNLDKYLNQKLDIAVELNNPFKEIMVGEKEFDTEFITHNAQIFNVGVGLALRQVG
jgi:type IV pilus assembly protein PilM